jgi:hypothetical protein
MKNKKFIATIVLVVFMNMLAISVWFYFFLALKKHNEAILEIRRNTLINDKKSDNNKILKNLISGIANERQKIDSVFLSQENIIKLVRELEANADRAGAEIDLGNINISEDGKKNPRIHFSLKGKFNQIFHYVVLLENMPYIVSVDKAHFEKDLSSGGWRGSFEISLNNFINQ